MAEFQPPEKGRGVYIALNIALLAFLYYCIAFHGVLTAWSAFAAGGFFLFNGAWSVNRRLFPGCIGRTLQAAAFAARMDRFSRRRGGDGVAAGICALIF